MNDPKRISRKLLKAVIPPLFWLALLLRSCGILPDGGAGFVSGTASAFPAETLPSEEVYTSETFSASLPSHTEMPSDSESNAPAVTPPISVSVSTDATETMQSETAESSAEESSTEHIHSWVTETRTVKEAWDETVIIKEAWDETVIIREAWDETVIVKEAWDEVLYEVHMFCGACGVDFDDPRHPFTEEERTAHIKAHFLAGESSRSYTDFAAAGVIRHEAETETVHHEALTEIVHHPAETAIIRHEAVQESFRRCSICGLTEENDLP